MIRKGITLTETLVVILIICIVTSILLPVFVRSKDKAKQVVCTSNMKQIYLAMKLYEADYDEYPPNSVVWPGFASYYPTVLACPKGTAPLPEFHYLLYGHVSPLTSPEQQAAQRECINLRQGEFPLIRDLNHLISTNLYHPASVYYFVREHGGFSVVRSDRLRSVVGPCDVSFVSLESNL